MSSILVILLNYRTAEMTLRAAKAALVAMEDLNAELVIVDNDSGDGSEAVLRAADLPKVRIIQSGRNGGFGAGNNVGIRARLSDGSAPNYVYILNSDAFPAPDAIARLAAHLDAQPEASFAGSQIHGEDGDVHMTAFRFPSIWSELEGSARLGPLSRILRSKAVPIGIPSETQRVDWLAGASIMMRQSVLDEIGLFDEEYFLYFEETDLCLRAARAGHQTHYVADSHVMHIGSVSTGMGRWSRIPQFWLDSRWRYFQKNHGVGYAMMATAAHLTGGALWRLRCILQRRPRLDPPKLLLDMFVHDLKAAVGKPSGNRKAVRGTPSRAATEARVE